MSVYAIYLNEPDEDAWKALKETWPDRHFILTDCMAFAAPQGITTTSDIINAVGIGEEREVVGIVFELNANGGYNRGDLWEWLRKANE